MAAKISIIIANYNNGRYFAKAFDSLVNQTFSDWEAIIIDDASTDDSVLVIKKLISSDTRARFYENEINCGYQKSLLRGIELAQAEIIGRLDPDDALYPKALELSLLTHEHHPEVGLVYSDITFCNNKLEPFLNVERYQITILNRKYYSLKNEIGSFATFKKKIYKQTSGIDDKMKRAEDKDFYMKMCEIAPVKRIPQPLYFYRILQSSLSKGENEERSFFWHFVALTKMAERRNLNIEDLFSELFLDSDILIPYRGRQKYFVRMVKNNLLLSKLWIKSGRKL